MSFKKIILSFGIIMSSVLASTSINEAKALTEYDVDGGRISFDFNNENDQKLFDLYTEFDKKPYYLEGKLYFWSLAEQKVIYKGRKFNDVDVSCDISTLNNHGKFDSGIYVQASNIASGMDKITGFCVNLERAADQNTFYLKLHQFRNGWLGVRKEVSGLSLPMNKVHLRVVVKFGILNAFVNYNDEPTITYNIGDKEGFVGLRNYYSPNYVTNLSIIGDANDVYFGDLDKAKAELEKIDQSKVTEYSKSKIVHYLSQIETSYEVENQYLTDELTAEINEFLKNVQYKRSFDELQSLIKKAEAIDANKDYTFNSINALQMVLEICKDLKESDSEDDISYWTIRLQEKINNLVEFDI